LQLVIMRSRHSVPVLVVLAGLLIAAAADARRSRDLLWILVTTCLNPNRAEGSDHCVKPRADEIDNRDSNCATTTQVWAQSTGYVAIRDQRMCNCPAGFVHGLALPFARIPGIEADHLPEGIWKFAWDAAHTRIEDEETIALVVNPPAQRSQDQLHIHLVRRGTDACERLPAASTASVPNLDHVWDVAKTRAKASHFTNYGVLVTRCSKDAFTVVVEEEPASGTTTPEKQYTRHDCR
jgi:CDP-diacylglycerol pyrophosphatase